MTQIISTPSAIKRASPQKIASNILDVYKTASKESIDAGLRWYEVANKIAKTIAKKHDLPINGVVGAIAALSPQTPWLRNLASAVAVAEHGMQARSRDPTLFISQAALEKAVQCLNSGTWEGVINASKTLSFATNIAYPREDTHRVTIDTWAIRAACASCNISNRTKGMVFRTNKAKESELYRRLKNGYQEAAKTVCILPHQMQAIVWLEYRLAHSLQKSKQAHDKAELETTSFQGVKVYA